MLRGSRAVFVPLCLTLLACGSGKGEGLCQHNSDCPSGQGCASGACAVVPCGGSCAADEACGTDNTCVKAQGASCASHTCPAGYPCNAGGVCARSCTLDAQCDTGFICNSALKSCAQCSNSTQCEGTKATPVCDDAGSGTCVACNVNFDCTKALGSGHFCDAHLCKPGCKGTADCNASLGETCDTTATTGRCIQCKVNADCAAQGPAASACDETGHCVQCYGTTPAAAKIWCGSGTPECNLASKTCVACLPANDASGQDCGYPFNGTMDPHDARTCNPATYRCQDGCQFDAQCGCPRTASGGAESACPRDPDQEHCDPSRTTMAGVTSATLGACVQCTTNTHCEYRIIGSTLPDPVSRPRLNGARCVTDSCVEGCDTDADCWPDHATTNGKICHLGAPGDANNHQCVECKCDVPGADPSFCEFNTDSTRACSNTTGGNPRVCDASTLSCRLKRQGESCDANTECGAEAPGSQCFALGAVGGVSGTGFCTLFRNADYATPTLSCSPSKGVPGRCADFYNGSCACTPNSAHAPATSTHGSSEVCVPTSCSYH